jgi:sterol desaturase/sphingolipid hydroxylase (fatty acid hydroxylase superfamily)
MTATITATITGVVVSFFVLLMLFRAIERGLPRERRLPLLRTGFWTDAIYWVFTPLSKGLGHVVVVAGAIAVAMMAHGKIDPKAMAHGFGPLSRLALWQQAPLILLLGDFVGYWMHRLFHGRRLWRFHAVHHSSQALDWLSAVRVHPVNDAVMRLAGTVPVLALGFTPGALAGVAPGLTLMAILLHANVDWDWGPLRSWIASPVFHRWHHTREAEGRDKNFAGLLPHWDRLFGTYYMPQDRTPALFGTDTPLPTGLMGQIVYPFRCAKPPRVGLGTTQ